MKIDLFEAEDDYIRVGNIMLPRDAREFGYDSYDDISRKTQKRYDDEKEAERVAKEREEAERQRQAFIKEHEAEISVAKDILESDNTADKKLEDLFEPFVKRSGTSDTQGGEIVRAYNRIDYRRFNDGDFYYEGYGLETCGGDVSFLIEETNDTIANLLIDYADKHIKDWQLNDETYKNFIEGTLAEAIVDYLTDNLDLFAVPAVADCRSYDSEVNSEYVEDWKEEGRCHDYGTDLDMDDNFSQLLEAGILDADDVAEDFFRDLNDYFADPYEIDVYARGERLEISNLTRDELDLIEREFWDSFERWAQEKWNENKDEIKEYFADEYEEDEDEDEDFEDED